MTTEPKKLHAESIDSCIQLLRQYVEDDGIEEFITTLEAVKADPGNPAMFEKLSQAFDELGVLQGAVLTYAPYITVILSDDPHIPPDHYEEPPGGFDDDYLD